MKSIEPRKLWFTCSFDDGHPSDLRTAELLARHGMRATFYLPISNREGYPVLDAGQMRALAQGFEIGSHTHDHCFLPALEDAAAQRQIAAGKQRLEQILGRPSHGFCYPGGKYGRRELALVRAAGFAYARTTVNLCLERGDSAFEMPTTLQFYPHPRQVLVRNFARHGHWSSRGAVLYRALSRRDWSERLHCLLEHAAARGGIFHLWGHSRDIDMLDAWPLLDRFLAAVAATVAPENRIDNHQLARLHGLRQGKDDPHL